MLFYCYKLEDKFTKEHFSINRKYENIVDNEWLEAFCKYFDSLGFVTLKSGYEIKIGWNNY